MALKSIKKFYPILVFILGFTGFLLVQVGHDVFNLVAKTTTKEQVVRQHYQKVFESLSVKTMKKEKIKLSEINAPIVVLNFWASWCAPCLAEFPTLVELKKRFSDDEIRVLAINSEAENKKGSILKLQEMLKVNFQMISDYSGEIFQKFLVNSIPMSIVFKNGKVIDVINGAKDFSSMETIENYREHLKL